MFENLVKWYKKVKQKYLLSEKTYYLLNSLTLEVSDPEILKEYQLARSMRFNSLFKYMLVLNVVYFLYRVYQVLVLNAEMLKLIYAAQLIGLMVVWFLVRGRRLQRFAPLVGFLYLYM